MGGGVAAGQPLGFAERELRVRKREQVHGRGELRFEDVAARAGQDADAGGPE